MAAIRGFHVVAPGALGAVPEAAEGYNALTTRSVPARLDAGPASLYAHVVNTADLDELLIGRLCSRIDLPSPLASRWHEQNEGVLAILITRGVDPQAAVWTSGTLYLRPASTERTSSPDSRHSRRPLPDHPTELTSGSGHERFDFTLALLLGNLARS